MNEVVYSKPYHQNYWVYKNAVCIIIKPMDGILCLRIMLDYGR